jgi:hypothetical protein
MESIRQSLQALMPVWAADLLTNTTFLTVVAASFLTCALACCRIFSKAGYPAALGLLLLVPPVNVVAFLTLAFMRWPIERQLRDMKPVQAAARKADSSRLRRAS